MSDDLLEAVDTGSAASKLEELRRRFLGDWLSALDDFNAVQEQLSAATSSGALDAAAASSVRASAASRLVEAWHGLLDSAYQEAHRLGRDVWGPGTAKAGLSPAAEKVLRREKQFAFRFAMDVAKGPEKEGRRSFPAGRRSAMYGQAVEGAFHRGAVDGAPPGQLIWWRLGDARHCVDCPILASNSPYTKETLPTVPRAGSTECWTSCKCRLEFGLAPGVTRGAPPPEPSPEEAADDLERGRPVQDRIEGPKPTPPPGSRLPTEKEDRQIQDLRHRMAFANRRADRAHARGDFAERDRWLRIRSDLNGKLIDFEGSRGIWAPPTFSDKEVLTSADLKAGDVSWLTHLRGIDGTTVHRAQAAAVEASAKAARESLGELLDSLPPGGGPAVPDFDELLRRAGAPSSTFTGTFDSAAWEDPRALVEAAEVADPADHLVLSAVGLGAAATLAAVPALLEECRERPYRVAFGPFGDGWEEAALRFGVWLDGDGEDARALLAAASRRIGGRGLEVSPWQP